MDGVVDSLSLSAAYYRAVGEMRGGIMRTDEVVYAKLTRSRLACRRKAKPVMRNEQGTCALPRVCYLLLLCCFRWRLLLSLALAFFFCALLTKPHLVAVVVDGR